MMLRKRQSSFYGLFQLRLYQAIVVLLTYSLFFL